MITLTILFTILYLLSWYNFYKSDYDIADMNFILYVFFALGNIIIVLGLILLIGLYLP
jgi:hypothetical protein